MPTVDVSNLIRRAAIAIVQGLGSPFALFVAFALAVAALGTSMISVFEVAMPNLDAFRLPDTVDPDLPFLDVICYIANVDLFCRVYNYFIGFINTLIPFISVFSASFIGALLVYRHSVALRNQITAILVK